MAAKSKCSIDLEFALGCRRTLISTTTAPCAVAQQLAAATEMTRCTEEDLSYRLTSIPSGHMAPLRSIQDWRILVLGLWRCCNRGGFGLSCSNGKSRVSDGGNGSDIWSRCVTKHQHQSLVDNSCRRDVVPKGAIEICRGTEGRCAPQLTKPRSTTPAQLSQLCT
jgi:hypothetical protein